MKLSSRKAIGRSAFTLVELLVVMAIIGIAVGLLSATLVKAMAMIDETRNRSDIHQLNMSVVNFQTTWKVPYMPSRIKLKEGGAYNVSLNPDGTPVDKLEFDSAEFLQRMFPKINLNPQLPAFLDWNGNGINDTGKDVVLEGDQCLVFFLGGIPIALNAANTTPGVQGFSTNPTNPTMAGGERTKILFEFRSTRLQDIPRKATPTVPTGFYSYVDAYGKKQPYAYFSSYKSTNGYNRYYAYNLNPNLSDCDTLQVWPYAEAAMGTPPLFPNLRYLKPDSFQIISAGRDGLFGPGQTAADTLAGTFWTPAKAGAYGQKYPNVKDDQTNFYERAMGTSN